MTEQWASGSVLVLGMHRSGTSSVTRVVHALGLAAPLASDMLPASSSNPEGHWESKSLMRFNDLLLLLFGGATFSPPTLPPSWEARSRARALYPLARLVHRRSFPSSPWVWKEPQLCLTLPFWLRALNNAPVLLLVLRSPSAICASLRMRDGMATDFALATWERYLRSALSAAAGHILITVNYDSLVHDPDQEVDALAQALSSRGVRLAAPAHVAATHVRRLLRHHVPGIPPEASPQQRHLCDLIYSLPRVAQAPTSTDLGGETPSLQSIFLLHRQSQLVNLLRPHPVALS